MTPHRFVFYVCSSCNTWAVADRLTKLVILDIAWEGPRAGSLGDPLPFTGRADSEAKRLLRHYCTSGELRCPKSWTSRVKADEIGPYAEEIAQAFEELRQSMAQEGE